VAAAEKSGDTRNPTGQRQREGLSVISHGENPCSDPRLEVAPGGELIFAQSGSGQSDCAGILVDERDGNGGRGLGFGALESELRNGPALAARNGSSG